jgi:hypothetical protein
MGYSCANHLMTSSQDLPLSLSRNSHWHDLLTVPRLPLHLNARSTSITILGILSNYGLLPQDTSLRHPGLYLGYCVTPSNYGLLPQDTSLRERGVLRHSVKLRTSTPGYVAETSRPTWGIVSLRQTTDFYPRIHHWDRSRPTWGIASLCQTVYWCSGRSHVIPVVSQNGCNIFTLLIMT